MTQKLEFSKMQGCGNDFIMLNAFAQPELTRPEQMGKLAERLCDRHFGIGADGVIVLYPAGDCDFCMRIFQPDGSEAEMCGNGMRCAALFARQEGIAAGPELRVQTLAGLICPSLQGEGLVRVNMGQPRLAGPAIPCTIAGEQVVDQPIEAAGREFLFTAVSMGNPHGVIFLEGEPANLPLTQLGPLLERHEVFPARANIEFVQMLDEHTAQARVWERAAGETLACGTGACAIAVAARLTGRGVSPLEVRLPGGRLQVDWAGPGQPVYLTGPAELSFNGWVALP